MLVDCQTCPVRGVRCDGCMVTAMLTPDSGELPLDSSEQAAVSAFVEAGLVARREAAGLVARREPWSRFSAVG